MTATRYPHSIELDSPSPATSAAVSGRTQGVLYLAFELGWNDWKLAFATGSADNPRLRTIGARNTQTLLQEIAKAKARFGLDENVSVRCCYEAGRDGFWLHRFLESQGIANEVVDSSSIEVKRQGRRRKTVWRYLETGEVPSGARTGPWKKGLPENSATPTASPQDACLAV